MGPGEERESGSKVVVGCEARSLIAADARIAANDPWNAETKAALECCGSPDRPYHSSSSICATNR